MWYIITLLIAIIYLFIYLILPGTIGGVIEAYVIRPLLWISLAIMVILLAQREEINIWQAKKIRRWQIGRSPFEAALLFGGFQVSVMVLAGLYYGFGHSPYSHSPTGIMINIVFVGSMLLGTELSRAYLIKKGTSGRRNITLILLLVTLLFMIIQLAPTAYINIYYNNPATSVKFIGEQIIPLYALSLFASYLAYLGGAKAALGYVGVLEAFKWLSPLLPDLNWAVTALIGTLIPAIGFLIIQNSIQLEHGTPRILRKKTTDPMVSWTGIVVAGVVLVFFSFGYFGAQPTIIYSGSMRPTIEVGDVVIISQVPIENLNTGDIIQYRSGNTKIVHRIYDITDEDNNRFFITKGDANDEPDFTPIDSKQITGKTIFTIPKVGWIPITIRQMANQLINAI